MPGLFDDIYAGAQSIFDDALGEPVTIEPQVTGRPSRYVAGGAVPGLPPFDVIGIFRDSVVAVKVMGSGANTHENADLLTDRTTVDFDAAQFDATHTPVAGWFVTFTTRPGSPRWRIEAVKPDNVARITCVLTSEKSAPSDKATP